MSKRISEVERIQSYFQSADESAATVMFQVVKGIMASRFQTPKVERKKRGPNKPKVPPELITGDGYGEKVS